MYKLIKQTLLKRTGNRRNYKNWERFIVYLCDKKLSLPYSFYPGGEKWDKLRREEDIKKFEKWIKNFEEDEQREMEEFLEKMFGPTKVSNSLTEEK